MKKNLFTLMTVCVLAFCGFSHALAALPFGNGFESRFCADNPPLRDSLVLFFDDFETSDTTCNWICIDADGDTDTWRIIGSPFGPAHSGEKVITSWSWNGISYDPDNWMISPLVEGATHVHYYVATNTTFPDYYGLFASTTGIDTSDFILVFDEVAYNGDANGDGGRYTLGEGGGRPQSEWFEKNIELPEGTKYVAFRHFNSPNKNYLLIDDVTIYAIEPEPTGIANNGGNTAEMLLYPNPTSGMVRIKAENMSHITVLTALGQVVFDAAVITDTYELNTSSFGVGTYLVRIATEHGISSSRLTIVR